jgi:hypothetical protein
MAERTVREVSLRGDGLVFDVGNLGRNTQPSKRKDEIAGLWRLCWLLILSFILFDAVVFYECWQIRAGLASLRIRSDRFAEVVEKDRGTIQDQLDRIEAALKREPNPP